jgi:hypothetical protein
VAHLRACADVWGGSIDRMVAEEHPTIRYVSPRSWIRKTDLSRLDTPGWSRRTTFTGITLGREATVLSYATRIADHEVLH